MKLRRGAARSRDFGFMAHTGHGGVRLRAGCARSASAARHLAELLPVSAKAHYYHSSRLLHIHSSTLSPADAGSASLPFKFYNMNLRVNSGDIAVPCAFVGGRYAHGFKTAWWRVLGARRSRTRRFVTVLMPGVRDASFCTVCHALEVTAAKPASTRAFPRAACF